MKAWSVRHWVRIRRAVDWSLARPNELARDAERFAHLAEHLPPHGPVGYLNEYSGFRPDPEDLRDPQLLQKLERARDRLVVASYVLAPHVVLADREARWTITSVPPGAAVPFREAAAFALRVDAGDGIALYEHVERR